MDAIAQKLENIVSTGVVAWDNLDSCQEQIKGAITPPNHPNYVVYPHTQAELSAVMTCADAHQLKVIPCGNASKINWGGLAPNVDLIVSTQRLNKLIQHAVGDLTVTVEAGIKFADVQATLAQSGQFIALDPCNPEIATIGGIVATADTGSLRQRYGSVRDQLLGITFVRADGKIAKAGGRVVKNVAGYDLMKLFTGSYGTLGAIASVTFRVYPLPAASATVIVSGEQRALTQLLTSVRASALTPTMADLLSTQLVARMGVGEGLGFIARFQSLAASVERQSTALSQLGQQVGLQTAIYTADDEVNLWQKLQQLIRSTTTKEQIFCKIGVLPASAVATMIQIDAIAPESGMSLIHSGSGLGLLRFDGEVSPQVILQMRSLCESQSGFLSVLTAPASLKQQLDVWGYSGNAIDVMRRIKAQFDPKNIFSPCRFVGGI